MFCKHCGNEVVPDAAICVNCGRALDYDRKHGVATGQGDGNSVLWGILGFLIPILGIILYFVWKDEKPKSAKAAGIGALVCICAVIVVYLFMFIMLLILIPLMPTFPEQAFLKITSLL